MRTFWATFYSYKGGVGRSLALANVAALLVRRGHRVVLLDFDLEAPGLDTFAEFAAAKGKPGIVEYVAEFQRQQVAPKIPPFVHPIGLAEHLRGKLWIMPAGRKDAAYHWLLARTRWTELYEQGLGPPFVANWKLSIEQEFHPDYVLMDSRTGLTEVGGVCTTAFPDLVVMLYGLNEQNLEGTASVARHIREADLDHPPQLHFVATPVPNLPPDRNSLLRERIGTAEKTLGIEIGNNSIRYWPPAALTERLFVLEDTLPEPGLVQDHKRLCEAICEFNRSGLDFLTAQTEEVIQADDSEIAGRIAGVLKAEYPERAEAVFLRARLAKVNGAIGDAVLLAEEAFVLDPTCKPPFDYLHAHFRRCKQPERIESLFERVLSIPARLSPARRRELLHHLAELRMSLGKYHSAALGYGELLNLIQKDQSRPSLDVLAYSFNAAESARRDGQQLPITVWQTLIQLFDSIPVIDGPPLLAANRFEAMHIPYALTGNLAKARDCLRKARRIAESVNDLETLFTVRDYKHASRAEYLAINDELLAALEQGRLWDGTQLPQQLT